MCCWWGEGIGAGEVPHRSGFLAIKSPPPTLPLSWNKRNNTSHGPASVPRSPDCGQHGICFLASLTLLPPPTIPSLILAALVTRTAQHNSSMTCPHQPHTLGCPCPPCPAEELLGLLESLLLLPVPVCLPSTATPPSPTGFLSLGQIHEGNNPGDSRTFGWWFQIL